jgi:hypothetical protein
MPDGARSSGGWHGRRAGRPGRFAGQHGLLHSVGIDQHAGLGVTLAGAFRDIRRDGLVCEIRGDNFRCPDRGRQVRTKLSAVS